ncbi:hypothetical protein AZH53_05425 [Methanomicrobiaceae archaeon CYW5]|uniref:TIGR00297 family protein n=1 Tax=Methanovulcanius yangii TaxID=1789227 RepID=UPI0029C9F162|nr:TIGR00297 family protein [Methanovulcanius yangii]MBT8507852.1 hypothetical protein [Methanovulcanius yangii]
MEKEPGMVAASLLALVCIIIAPFITPAWLLSLFVILICALLFLVKKSLYTSFSIAVIAALYGIGVIPLVVFSTTFAIIILGEAAYRIGGRNHAGYIPFTVVATASAFLVMLYSGYNEPLVAITGVVVALILHSALGERNDKVFIETLGVAMTMLLFYEIDFTVDFTLLATAVVIAFAFGYFSYRMKAADLPGIFAAILLGILLIVFADVTWFLVMLAFFIMGSAMTRYRYDAKTKMGVAEGHGGVRGYFNVFANGLAGVAAAVLFGITGDPAYTAFYLGSVGCATADTLASEVGVTGGTPRLITTLRQVPCGTNGGVTLKGEVAGTAGAFILGVIAYLLGVADVTLLVITTLGGFVGTNIDSLIGALWENKGIFGNAGTNFLATLLAGLFAMGVYILLV